MMSSTTTRAPRSDARRDYRQFPAAYTLLLEQFEATGKPIRLEMNTLKDAKAARRDFYRFKGFLMRAVDDDHDEYAKELVAIFNKCSVRLEGTAPGQVPAMILDRNPLVRAVEALAATN
jgi:hypothetical protein